MNNNNKLKIIPIDHGYKNIKTNNICFPTGLTELKLMPDDKRGVIKFNNKIYLEGGQKLNYVDNTDKTTNEDYYILTLISIAKELKLQNVHDARVHLVTGLPQRWYDKQKEGFEKYLKKYKDVNFKYENEVYNIKIDKVSVYSQGYSAFMGLDNASNYLNKEVYLVDIGGGTINIIRCDNGRIVTEGSKIETRATIWLMKQIQEIVESELGVPIPESIIIDYMQKGGINKTPKNKYEKIIQKELISYAELILRLLKEYRINIDLTPIFFIGGGSIIMKNFAKFGEMCDVHFVTDLKANAKGYKTIAQLIG